MDCAVLGCDVMCFAVLCCSALEVIGSLTVGLHGAQEVAGQVRKHHDGPKGVSRRESFRLSHVIENRLANGGSGQGYGPHATHADALTSLEAFPEEPTPQQVCHDAHRKQYFNSDDRLMISTAESCSTADTQFLKTQAGLSCSVTATHICCAAEAGNSKLALG